jgi:hypothetical protein
VAIFAVTSVQYHSNQKAKNRQQAIQAPQAHGRARFICSKAVACGAQFNTIQAKQLKFGNRRFRHQKYTGVRA